MEALAHDLASALEETSGQCAGSGCSENSNVGGSAGGGVRRRWGFRRRAQSAGNLPLACSNMQPSGGGCCSKGSAAGASGAEDSSSSTGGTRERPVASALRHCVSDSDEDEDEEHGMMVSSSCGPDIVARKSDGAASLRSSSALTGSGLGGCLSVLAALGPASSLLPESDSLNENFSPTAVTPHACVRRKRKFKRMAVDSTALAPMPSGAPLPVPRPPPIHKRKSRMTATIRRLGSYVLLCGKRKRSARERGGLHAEYDALSTAPSSGMSSSRFERRRTRHVLALRKLSLSDPAPKSSHSVGNSAGDLLSSSSLSSSESDAGLYTNDEGREGDDEQSDWVGGGGGGWWEDYDPDDGSPERLPSDRVFDAILTGSLAHMSEESKASYRMRMQGLSDREIRAGRRRLRPERPGFSVLTSANEKLSRFLQDSAQSELRLHPMQAPERAQLGHLAALYSLHMRTDAGSRPVLTKTQDTMRAVRVDQLASGLSGSAARRGHGPASADFKRRRRLPPQQQLPTSDNAQPMEVAAGVPPLSETNIGCRLLKSMGWTPGQGLGPGGTGTQEPITASLRPRLLGLGHSYKSS
ncbi:Uncharacterized protein GBIM_17071 [Gryllus bimaculatus]|nr:Uncharacterized protein GBIM_17071 [Gryllus bimaculatus]